MTNPRRSLSDLAAVLLLMLCVPCMSAANETKAEPADHKQQPEQGVLGKRVCIECHYPVYEGIRHTPHWVAGDPRTPNADSGCERCHGPGEQHVLTLGENLEDLGLLRFSEQSPQDAGEQNALCLECHRDPSTLHWPGSAHASEDVACVQCHSVHQPDLVLDKTRQTEVCYRCHQLVRTQTLQPHRHPIAAGNMSCSDCHEPHGSAGDFALAGHSTTELCYSCHAEKRGPFLWEHQPASEDCELCHSAHGSLHPGMLTRRQPHLCQSCHETIGNTDAKQHVRLALSYRVPGSAEIGPGGGSIGISRFVLGESCMQCHTKVHGSNHPSGAFLLR